jgi:hypothetical protein
LGQRIPLNRFNSMKVIVKLDSIKPSINRLATGQVCFSHNDAAFPELNWNDFVVVLVTEWAKEITRLLKEAKGQISLHFMDGPFIMQLKRKNPGWVVNWIRNGVPVDSFEIASLAELGQSLVLVGQLIVSRLRENQVKGLKDDIQGLKAALENLADILIQEEGFSSG